MLLVGCWRMRKRIGEFVELSVAGQSTVAGLTVTGKGFGIGARLVIEEAGSKAPGMIDTRIRRREGRKVESIVACTLV